MADFKDGMSRYFWYDPTMPGDAKTRFTDNWCIQSHYNRFS
jgi:hypothetical protein